MTARVILHVDMNAFFASVEQQANPALRGKPVAVTGAGGRTIVTTASYEARAFGVRTGMNVHEARRACPELIFVVGDHRKYISTSRGIIAILKDFTPVVEVFSIDEAFLDITGSVRLFGSAEEIATGLKRRIRESFGLTCSVGIAPNKLLAKVASEMKKPDGLTIVPPDRVSALLERMPVRELCGIGAKTARQLELLGIRTCAELGRYPVEVLRKRFGIVGERLSQMGRGIDDSPVIPDEEAAEVKSVGHSTTLDRDVEERGEILRILLQLSEMVGRRARRHGVRGRTVTLTVRYADFTTFSRQATTSGYTDASDEIHRAAVGILDTLLLAQPVRLLGVRLSGLKSDGEQLPLFSDERKKQMATRAMDAVNGRYGESTLTFGTLIDKPVKESKVISPAWRPIGIRSSECD